MLSAGWEEASRVVTGSLRRLLLSGAAEVPSARIGGVSSTSKEGSEPSPTASSSSSSSSSQSAEPKQYDGSPAAAAAAAAGWLSRPAAAARRLLAFGAPGGWTDGRHSLRTFKRVPPTDGPSQTLPILPAEAAETRASGFSKADGGDGPLTNLTLLQCPLLNASACPVTLSHPVPGGGWLVVVYNPLGLHRGGFVRLPVPEGVDGWSVQGECWG